MLEPLLTDYYGKSYEESYQLLRKSIEARFRSKDTNSKYRAILLDELEDLILTVILRLLSISSKSLNKKGERIRNPELMSSRIADFVYQEELRAIRKRLNETPIDEDDSEGKAPPIGQAIDGEIQAIENEIMRKCYAQCLGDLPAHIAAVFRAYYPDAVLDAGELVAVRKRLANEEAGLTEAQAQSQTPEQQARTLNNLQSKVNKWRKTHVEECVKKCVEECESRHPRLNYLREQ